MECTITKTQRLDSLTRRDSWRNLILVLYLVYGVLVNVVMFGLPLRALHLGASEVLLGGIVSGFVSTGVAFSFFGAALCDRLGERSLLVGAFACYTLANGVGVLAGSPALLVLAAFTAGVGDMLFTVGGMTYLAHLVKDRGKDLPISIAFSLLRIGSVVGLAGAGRIVETSGFEPAFMASAFLSIAGSAMSVALPKVVAGPGRTPAPARGILGPFKAAYDLFRENQLVRIAVAVTSLGTVGWFTFRSSFYLDYLHRIGMSPGTMGILTALGSMACIVAPFIYSLLGARIEPLRAIAVGQLAAGLGLAATPLLRTAVLIGAVAIPAQMGDFFRFPGAYWLLSVDTSPEEQPVAMAFMNTSWAVAALLAGPLWALVIRAVGLSSTFYIAGLATVAGAFALFRFRGRRGGAVPDGEVTKTAEDGRPRGGSEAQT
jgi:predicted MFS family arabinose efflux permease